MKNNTKNADFPVVLPFSRKGKILVKILRILYGIVGFFQRDWKSPRPLFEENPAYFKIRDVLYLGYKYYYSPPTKYPPQIINYFREQKMNFEKPNNFEIKSEITLSAGGDLMPYEWVQKPYTQNLWDEVGDFFFGADIVFANLETPIHLGKPPSLAPEVMLSDMHFNANEEIFEIFSGNGFYKGYDVLSTANNHSMDMGKEGVLATIDFLEKKGIAYTGTAKSLEDAKKCCIIERRGIRVAFVAYTYSLNKFLLDEKESFLVNVERLNRSGVCLDGIKEKVQQAHEQKADIVVLSLHTGNAYQTYPSEHTIQIYHRIFEECGVDIILGSHPHNAQPMEKYTFNCPFTRKTKNGFAIYSLADFVAYDIFVLDRLIPLLKLHIAKGKLDTGEMHTQVVGVEVLPTYNWGQKNAKKNKEMRFLNLKKLISSIETGKMPDFMTEACKKEAMYLYDYWQKYLSVCEEEENLSEKDK